MDVDENNAATQNEEIEQSFLQQFSCLGTTDHEELVSKFQKLLGHQLNYSTARFFLDMNNWNLQAAVGCYFDYYSGQKLPSMQIIADVTVGEGESVTPNTLFQQSWKVQNNGDERWPDGCFIKLTSIADGPQIPVAAINPGEKCTITVQLASPAETGSFQTKWRLCTPNGSHFGDTIWAIVQVTPTGTLAITQQLSDLHTSGAAAGPAVSTALCHHNFSLMSPIPLPPPPTTAATASTHYQPQPTPPSNSEDNEMC